MTSDELRQELDRLFDAADLWPNGYNLGCLGAFILRHPEVIGREETPRMKGEREFREKRRRRLLTGETAPTETERRFVYEHCHEHLTHHEPDKCRSCHKRIGGTDEAEQP